MKQELAIIEEQESEGVIEEQPDAATGIPAATWALLQDSGHMAAQRLRDLLDSAGFSRMKPTDQARLIELAMNRAYGPPIKRAATLELRGSVSDEVANSLARLSSVDLPENGGGAGRAERMQRMRAKLSPDLGDLGED